MSQGVYEFIIEIVWKIYFALILIVIVRSCHNFAYVMTAPGGRLNKKDGLTRYGNSHVKDKTS